MTEQQTKDLEVPCPNCCGAGYFGFDSDCRDCGGTGRVIACGQKDLAALREQQSSKREVPWWHPAASELKYWINECGRLHGVCADRYDEIERLEELTDRQSKHITDVAYENGRMRAAADTALRELLVYRESREGHRLSDAIQALRGVQPDETIPSTSPLEQKFIFGMEEPVTCKCGKVFTVRSDREGYVKALHCTCGQMFEISGKLVLLPAVKTIGDT